MAHPYRVYFSRRRFTQLHSLKYRLKYNTKKPLKHQGYPLGGALYQANQCAQLVVEIECKSLGQHRGSLLIVAVQKVNYQPPDSAIIVTTNCRTLIISKVK